MTTANQTAGRIRSKFTVQEDEQLKSVVNAFPSPPWSQIALMFPGKTARQVRDRYQNYLSPELNHLPWTEAEDNLLREKFVAHGPRWTVLRQFFGNRSDVSIKNRWAALVSKSQRAQFRAPVEIPQVGAVQPMEVVTPSVEADLVAMMPQSRRASFEIDPLDSFGFAPCDDFFGDSLWAGF